MWGRLIAAVSGIALLPPATAVGKGVELDSREYKLMLHAERFADPAPEAAVARFAAEQLVPAVREHWSREAAAELAAKGLKVDERRTVRFWDTRDCSLYRHGAALRDRADADERTAEADEVELTLKFRSADAFLAAGVAAKARSGAKDAESKLEEDLGPVAVRIDDEHAVVASPRAARSQFSRSTKQTVAPGAVPRTLGGVGDLYPTFAADLRAVGGRVDPAAALEPSPAYRELVFASSKLDLAAGVKTSFALTIWRQAGNDAREPRLAEISFKYPTDDGEVPLEVARRALTLLRAMQDLPWADPGAPTKTALVACDVS